MRHKVSEKIRNAQIIVGTGNIKRKNIFGHVGKAYILDIVDQM